MPQGALRAGTVSLPHPSEPIDPSSATPTSSTSDQQAPVATPHLPRPMRGAETPSAGPDVAVEGVGFTAAGDPRRSTGTRTASAGATSRLHSKRAWGREERIRQVGQGARHPLANCPDGSPSIRDPYKPVGPPTGPPAGPPTGTPVKAGGWAEGRWCRPGRVRHPPKHSAT